MKRSTFVGILLAVCVGLGLFQLKYEVMNLEQKNRGVRRSIHETLDAIHVLKAEWSHLNDPNRLQLLSEKHLGVEPVSGSQVVSFRAPVDGFGIYNNSNEIDQLVAMFTDDDDTLSLED